MRVKQFQKKTEDFTCDHCNLAVKGNGYTNHCSRCLWSKHADVNPGDRLSTCQGMMEPIGVEVKGGEYIIIHHCIKCGHNNKNKASDQDDVDVIIYLSSHPIDW